MGRQEHELWILIKAHDEATQSIKKTLRDLGKTIGQVVPRVGDIEGGFKRTGGAIAKAKEILSQFGIEAKRTRNVLQEIASSAKFTAVAIGTWAGIESMRDMVSYAIEYQKTIENARLSLAGIFSSVADIKDSSGKILQGQEKFNASLQISENIIKRLQQENLKTVARKGHRAGNHSVS